MGGGSEGGLGHSVAVAGSKGEGRGGQGAPQADATQRSARYTTAGAPPTSASCRSRSSTSWHLWTATGSGPGSAVPGSFSSRTTPPRTPRKTTTCPPSTCLPPGQEASWI